MAELKKPGLARLEHRIDCRKIPQPARRITHQRRAHRAPGGIARRRKKGRINRRRGKYRVSRFADGATGDIEAAHQAGQPDDPLGLDAPGEAALEIVDHGIDLARRGMVVAKYALLDPLPQGFLHRGRSGEIHVGDPQRYDTVRLPAIGVLGPFHRVGADCFRRVVEIEFHGAAAVAAGLENIQFAC